MTGWTLVEPCCGSAAFTLHMLGGRRQLVPYQGTKWPLRHHLAALATRLGFWGQPSRVVLGDVSPWARAVQTVLDSRRALLDCLRPLVEEGGRDPEELYARLHGALVPRRPAQMTAELLWLQRMAFAGKAVGVRGERWLAPGLNVTSAKGVPRTERFGAVKPLGPALLREVTAAPRSDSVTSYTGTLPVEVDGPTLVLLDPPYADTVDYPCGNMSRAEVLAYAAAWADAGAAVIVCEADPLPLDGWRTECLTESVGRGESSFRSRKKGKGAEWVTYRAAASSARGAA